MGLARNRFVPCALRPLIATAGSVIGGHDRVTGSGGVSGRSSSRSSSSYLKIFLGFTPENFELVQGKPTGRTPFSALFTAGFTPIPYKIFTVTAGVFGPFIEKYLGWLTLAFVALLDPGLRGRPLKSASSEAEARCADLHLTAPELLPFARFPSGRGVAQPGSAPASGAGGRRFKSSRPDQSLYVGPIGPTADQTRFGAYPIIGRKGSDIVVLPAPIREVPQPDGGAALECGSCGERVPWPKGVFGTKGIKYESGREPREFNWLTEDPLD